MNGNHPAIFEHDIKGRTLSPEESQAVLERVNRWLEEGLITEPEPCEHPVVDINGRKYTPEEVHEFIEQFSDR